MATADPGSSVDLEREKAELLEMHDLDRKAHLATDVQTAMSFFGDAYMYIRDGEIRQLARADVEHTYDEYFRGATFHEWDDLEPPVVRVSNDGSMAWMVSRFRVRYTHPEDGRFTEETYVYAGATMYEKHDGRWVRAANVSTFAEGTS